MSSIIMRKIGTTKSLGNKHIEDKFYTKEKVAEKIINSLPLSDFDLIIEPSAGNGNFSNTLEEQHHNVLAYDISPENEDIIKADWLTLNKNLFSRYGNILIIGNPPFGNNGNLALSFIKESAFAHTIAFILPKSFKKESIQNRVPLNLWRKNQQDLPSNSFSLNGEDYSVPCVFQIWERRDKLRKKINGVSSTSLFDFTKKAEADFRIQRVGGRAGKASTNLDVSEQSNYFVKNKSHYSIEELIEKINNTDFDCINDTVGPRSLSKTELINGLNL